MRDALGNVTMDIGIVSLRKCSCLLGELCICTYRGSVNDEALYS